MRSGSVKEFKCHGLRNTTANSLRGLEGCQSGQDSAPTKRHPVVHTTRSPRECTHFCDVALVLRKATREALAAPSRDHFQAPEVVENAYLSISEHFESFLRKALGASSRIHQ